MRMGEGRVITLSSHLRPASARHLAGCEASVRRVRWVWVSWAAGAYASVTSGEGWAEGSTVVSTCYAAPITGVLLRNVGRAAEC